MSKTIEEVLEFAKKKYEEAKELGMVGLAEGYQIILDFLGSKSTELLASEEEKRKPIDGMINAPIQRSDISYCDAEILFEDPYSSTGYTCNLMKDHAKDHMFMDANGTIQHRWK